MMTGEPDMDALNDLLSWHWNGGKLRLVNPDNLRQFWLEIKADYDSGEGWMLTKDELKQTTAINADFQDKKADGISGFMNALLVAVILLLPTGSHLLISAIDTILSEGIQHNWVKP